MTPDEMLARPVQCRLGGGPESENTKNTNRVASGNSH